MVKAQGRQLMDIRISEISSGHIGSRRGSYYRLRLRDNTNQAEERDPTLFKQPTSGRSGDCIMLLTPIRTLQRKLDCKAQQ